MVRINHQQMKIESVLLPISSIFLGYQITLTITKLQFYFVELLGAAFPIGMAFTSLLSLVLNPFLKCTEVHYFTQVGISFALSILLMMINRRLSHSRKIKLPHFWTILWLLGIISALTYLSYVSYVQEKGKFILTGENDLYLEASYISSFTYGINYDRGFSNGVMLPTVSGNKGLSEYLPTIYLALLGVEGIDIQCSIFAVTVLLFASIVLLQFSFTYRLAKSEFAAAMSVPVVFLSGGFGFLHFLVSRDRMDGYVDYVFNLGSGVFNKWGHPMIHCILTSRVVLLTMALSIICYLFIEIDLFFAAAVLIAIAAITRPQTAFALCSCYLLYKFKGIVTRIIYIIPISLILVYLGLRITKISPMFCDMLYNNSFFPFLYFPLSIFGILFASLIFSTYFTGKLVTSLFTFYLLTFVSLQEESRFNFFAILSAVVPIFAAISFAGMIRFALKWKSQDVQGSLMSLMFFAMLFMCLSAFTGVVCRGTQKFVAFDPDDILTSKWILENTEKTDVFLMQIPGTWCPATVLCGRAGYFGYSQWMQSAKYDNKERKSSLSNFLQNNVPIDEVDYYIFEKNSDWAQKTKPLIGKDIEVVFENGKYYILQNKA